MLNGDYDDDGDDDDMIIYCDSNNKNEIKTVYNACMFYDIKFGLRMATMKEIPMMMMIMMKENTRRKENITFLFICYTVFLHKHLYLNTHISQILYICILKAVDTEWLFINSNNNNNNKNNI